MRIIQRLTPLVIVLCSCSSVVVVFDPTSGGGTGIDESGGESSGQGATSTTGGPTGETTAASSESGSTGDVGSSGGSESTGGEVQCDIVLDDPLETDGTLYFSPCYTSETFHCTTCATWCDTVGFGQCSHVVTASACPPIQGDSSALCDADIEDIGGFFRCACES